MNSNISQPSSYPPTPTDRSPTSTITQHPLPSIEKDPASSAFESHPGIELPVENARLRKEKIDHVGPDEVEARADPIAAMEDLELDFPDGGLRAWYAFGSTFSNDISLLADSWLLGLLQAGCRWRFPYHLRDLRLHQQLGCLSILLPNRYAVFPERFSHVNLLSPAFVLQNLLIIDFLSTSFPFLSLDSSWIGSLQYCLVFLPALPIGRLLDLGYFKVPFFTSAVLYVIAVFLTAETSSYWQVLLCQGILLGASAGVMFGPALAYVSRTDPSCPPLP
jgi:hypothetical protein